MGRNESSILCGHLQANLQSLAVLGDDKAATIEGLFGAGEAAQIRAGAAVSWLPTELDRRLVRTIREVAGAEGVSRVMGETMRTSFEGPMFSPMVQIARKVHLLEPGAVMRLACTAYTLVHRNNGVLSVSARGEDSLELTLSGAAVETLEDDAYLHAYGAVFQSILRLARPEGTVQLIVRESEARSARFVCCEGPPGPLERALPKRPPSRRPRADS